MDILDVEKERQRKEGVRTGEGSYENNLPRNDGERERNQRRKKKTRKARSNPFRRGSHARMKIYRLDNSITFKLRNN